MTSGSATPEGVDEEQFEDELVQSGVNTSGTNWGTVWGAFGCLASKFALMIEFGASRDAGLGNMGLVLGTLALGIASAALMFSGLVSIGMSLVAAGLGVYSLVDTFKACSSMEGGLPTSAMLLIIIDVIALVVSGVGIILSIQYLCEHGGI